MTRSSTIRSNAARRIAVDEPPTSPSPAHRRRRTVLRLALGALVAVFGSMWVYVLFFAPKTGAYRVREESWRTQARQICAAATSQREALADTSAGYITNPTHEQMLHRADLVARATTILTDMVGRLDAVPLGDAKDRQRVSTFTRYYRVVLSDRQRYAERLRRFDNSPYDETVEHGGPVSNILTDFTAGNDITGCAPPNDIG